MLMALSGLARTLLYIECNSKSQPRNVMTRQIANPAADGTHTLSRIIGALDAKVRKKLRQWLRELHQQTGVTTLFATQGPQSGRGTGAGGSSSYYERWRNCPGWQCR